MTNAIRAELVKLRTTRMPFGLLAGMLPLVVLSVVSSILTAGRRGSGPPLSTEVGIRAALSSAGSGIAFVLVLGILAMAGEFRHNTATGTFLATPRRDRVVLAKFLVYGVVGAIFALVAMALTLAIALPWLTTRSEARTPTGGDLLVVFGGALLASAIYGGLGVSVGALVRNQIAAVLGALSFTFIVEGLLVSLLPRVGKWLPGGAANALVSAATPRGGLLPVWAAALVLLGYAVVLGVLGARFVVRRDVT